MKKRWQLNGCSIASRSARVNLPSGPITQLCATSAKVRGHDLANDLGLHGGVLDLDQRFHAAVQISAHPVSGGHVDPRLFRRQPVPVAEAYDARVFQETADDGFHADVLGQGL